VFEKVLKIAFPGLAWNVTKVLKTENILHSLLLLEISVLEDYSSGRIMATYF